MAVYDYGLTASDITREIPGVDPSDIGATGEPLNTTDIAQWITDGAANFNTLLSRSGITPSVDLDADAHAKIAVAVKSYVVHECLRVMGVTGALLDSARDKYNDTFAEISNVPQSLGAAYTEGITVGADNDENTDAWSFIDNEGSIW